MRLLIVALISLGLVSTAEARVRHHHHHHHYRHYAHRHHHHRLTHKYARFLTRHYRHWARHHYRHHHHEFAVAHGYGLVTVRTAVGSITVARDFEPKITGFIRDVVALGFHGPVHCFAAHGHIPGSMHHSGRACDFAQTGWNRTVRIMYSSRVTELAHKWGMRSGCEFHSRRDCGHIGMDGVGAHYASRHHHRRHYARN